jgi:AraC-like DNA-binding protein
MNPIAKDSAFVPLLGALKRIQFSLESVSPPCVMLAAQTMEEFNAQQLPSHCKVTRRKLHGKRIRVRNRNSNSNLIARWPQDRLVEIMSPMLLVVLSDNVDIPIVDYVVHCNVGDVLFFPARIPKFDSLHMYYKKVTPEAHCDLLLIDFLAVGLHSLAASIFHFRAGHLMPPDIGERCWIDSRELSLIFDVISEIAQHGRSVKSTFHLFAAVIMLLEQGIAQGKCLTLESIPSRSLTMDEYSPIAKAQEYIQNHLYTSLSINLVARWVGLSRNVFVQQFRKETGESFLEYLTRQRLEQAKVLLCESNLSIEIISARIGLSSGQLRNLFHDKLQCTPREFRKSQTKVRI